MTTAGRHRRGGIRLPSLPKRAPRAPRHASDAPRSRGAERSGTMLSRREERELLAGGVVRGIRLSGPIGQPVKVPGARAALGVRSGAKQPGVRQTPMSDRPDPHGALRAHYGTAQGRGRKPAASTRPARAELELRAKRSDARGRAAHTEFLPPARGRAGRPASKLPAESRERPGPVAPAQRHPQMSGRTFAGALGYGGGPR